MIVTVLRTYLPRDPGADTTRLFTGLTYVSLTALIVAS